MKTLRTAFTLFTLLWLSSAAQAAGEPPRFDGLYGGFVAGYGFADTGNFTLNATNYPGHDLDGPLAGLTGGWNWTHDNWLWGLEADGQAMGLQDTITCGGACNVTADIDGLVTARGRLGYLFGEDRQIAAYATGGLALVWHGVYNGGGAPPLATNWLEATYTVGAGIEGYVMGTDWMSTKLEYLYVGLNSNRSALVNTADTGTYRFDGMHLIRWGLNIHFN